MNFLENLNNQISCPFMPEINFFAFIYAWQHKEIVECINTMHLVND